MWRNCCNQYRLYKGSWIFNGRPQDELSIEKYIANQLLSRGGWLVRNVYDFDCKEETGFWYVIKDSFGGMEELPTKCRNCIRRSLKSYDIRPITPEEFRRIALRIFNGALSTYKVKASIVTQEDIDTMSKAIGQDFWAVYKKGTDEAVAVARNVVKDGFCDYGTLKCLPEALHNATYPYYGLIFEMNRYYLQEKGLMYVCDGARSITEHSNIQPFLMDKFRFRKASCKLNIFYKPCLKLAVNILYPFRKYLPLKMRSVLNMEAMRRGKM